LTARFCSRAFPGAGHGAAQIASGISFTGGEIVGPIGGFLVMGLFAIWIIFNLLRQVWSPAGEQSAPLRAVEV
jgi:hypothetical protein